MSVEVLYIGNGTRRPIIDKLINPATSRVYRVKIGDKVYGIFALAHIWSTYDIEEHTNVSEKIKNLNDLLDTIVLEALMWLKENNPRKRVGKKLKKVLLEISAEKEISSNVSIDWWVDQYIVPFLPEDNSKLFTKKYSIHTDLIKKGDTYVIPVNKYSKYRIKYINWDKDADAIDKDVLDEIVLRAVAEFEKYEALEPEFIVINDNLLTLLLNRISDEYGKPYKDLTWSVSWVY